MTKLSLRKRVFDMKKGDCITLQPGDKGFSCLRSYAYEIGFQTGNKYVTRIDRENKSYSIIRTA